MPPAKAATSTTTNAPLRIGYFGSIYKGKSPEALLDVCSELRRRGQRCTVTYVGSIVGASTGGEDWFSCEIAKRKLNEVVSVTGYIADERDLFTLFERIDVFLFVLPEGLSAKRASILTCLQSGRPVVASEPIDPTEFAHHPRYASLVEKGNVILIPHGASVADVASLVQQSITKSQANVPSSGIDYDTWWNDTSARVAAYM